MSRPSRIRIIPAAATGDTSVELVSQVITVEQNTLTVDTGATGVDYQPAGQGITVGQGQVVVAASAAVSLVGLQSNLGQGSITVDIGTAAWIPVDVDGDESIFNGQENVVVTITGTVAATGKKIWLEQSGNWVEQQVTGETAQTCTITVNYGGSLNSGSANLYVRNPL